MMKYLSFLLLFLFANSCSESTTKENKNTTLKLPKEVRNIPKDASQITGKIKQQYKCKISGEVLEDNELWLKDHAKLVCIMADSSTYDPKYGMSHRILEVFNTYNCSLDLKLTLPINESPDFPYFLADINYNNNSKIVAIKAAKTVYCLDLTSKKIQPVLRPKFKTRRTEVDPSSGMIIRLELWEDFLIGYAQDKGTFVFDLNKPNESKAILPFAEYQLGDNKYSSLFLLPSGNGKYQAIFPSYDWEEEIFSINPIYKEPIAVNTNIQKSALDNRFIILRQLNNNSALGIDLKKKKNIKLPIALMDRSTKEILEWLKNQ